MTTIFVLIMLAIAVRQGLRWVRQNPQVAAAAVTSAGRMFRR